MRSDVKKVGFKKSHIRRQFDRSAARYEQVASMQKTIANDLMKHSSLNLQSGNILDAGCGSANGYAEVIHDPGVSILWSDGSTNAIRNESLP